MVGFNAEYLAAGGNRHPSAADWDNRGGLLAYGAEKNLALWSPQDKHHLGVKALLGGHDDNVTVVRFFDTGPGQPRILLTGSVDATIRIWRANPETIDFVTAARVLTHRSSINCIGIFAGSTLVASGSADPVINITRLCNLDSEIRVEHVQSIQTSPRFFSLTLALHSLGLAGDMILAAAGTNSIVQVFTAPKSGNFSLHANLAGHEGWIRSLAFTREGGSVDSDLLLASASQDRYIRLWRVAPDRLESEQEDINALTSFDQSLHQSMSSKPHRLRTSQGEYLLTFEALLMGHDDWIYSISWQPSSDRLALLSASADNSLAIWQSEESSGVWYSTTRLGEISTQKGSTTATGSTGGFWVGLWSPNGDSLVSLGRTGSWRMWDHDKGNGRWIQRLAISGHTKSVNDVVWSKDGSYLLSTSSDQTTRLHATWRHGLDQSWHEMARPQIHGYDINCIASVSQSQFVSGADEKLLRVFDEPRDTAELLAKLSKIEPLTQNELPGSATIPVLGLSNKSMDYDPNNESDTDSHTLNEAGREQQEAGDGEKAHLQVPPFENRLGRHTLWPESEKLYGHGYEISAVAASHDGSLLATACKASALDHAVIRLYTTKDWRELKPALKAHSSTIHALSFSEDDSYLLSVGRDRQWAVFERDGLQEENYFLKSANLHAHKRQILATSWIPIEAGRIFVTASRDMSVKLWQIKAVAVECFMIIKTSSAAAAIDVAPILVNGDVLISVGLETGIVKLFLLDPHSWAVKSSHALDDTLRPLSYINKIAWKPIPVHLRNDYRSEAMSDKELQLAVASSDSSLRLFSVSGLFRE